MPHARARCQPNPATRRQINELTHPTHAVESLLFAFSLVTVEAEQWVARTRSRRVRRRGDWMKAVRFMVGAGLRAGANATTLRVAEDIARRMPRSKDGTVAYCQAGMIQRLRLSERCIALHIQILRELGLLAWQERGSAQRNARRTQLGDAFGPGDGFVRTATIYAAVAPPVWDQAMGRRIDGRGYNARVIGVTEAGRYLALADARREREQPAPQPHVAPVENPVDNQGACTPSVSVPQPRLTGASSEREIRDRATRRRARRSGKSTTRSRGSTSWTPQQAARAMTDARQLQLHTWWTQGSCVRELAYALRPLFAAGWTWEESARELARWTVPLRPRHAGAYITSEIRRRANSGALHLPDGAVRPFRQAPADEKRRDNWLARRAQEFESRWEQTKELRAKVRALVRPGHSGKRRLPPGLEQARPEKVLLTSDEIASLVCRTAPIPSNRQLWDELDQRSQALVAVEQRRERWEHRAPAPSEPTSLLKWPLLGG